MRKVADWKRFKMRKSLADMFVTPTVMLSDEKLINTTGPYYEMAE